MSGRQEARTAFQDKRKHVLAMFDGHEEHAPYVLQLAERFEDHDALIKWCFLTGQPTKLERYKSVRVGQTSKDPRLETACA